jgi:hypothetical protein
MAGSFINPHLSHLLLVHGILEKLRERLGGVLSGLGGEAGEYGLQSEEARK